VTRTSADIAVGVAFTVTVDYDLGTNPKEAHLSPVGNVDFAAGAYRLLASQVRFSDAAASPLMTATDRLYFPTLPAGSKYAEAIYTFIATTLEDTQVCPYTAVGYNSSHKYDQKYCSETWSTVVPITGTLSFALTKEVSSPTIEQNGRLTYTIHYTNDGSLPLIYVWIWDEVDPNVASVEMDTIAPTPDPDESTSSRVAWYFERLAPHATGTLTYTVLVDGGGADLADGTLLVNQASFGVNQDSLPDMAALTSTVTSTVLAPEVTISKTDGRDAVEPGEALTYSLRITNSGSVAATNIVITDSLPPEVSYLSGAADPPPSSVSDSTLTWEDLGPIPPGNSLVLTVPVSVGNVLPNGTELRNTASVRYQNNTGWIFDVKSAEDTTLVNAPVLSISKVGAPDPVLVGRAITYTLYYENNGPAAATNVVITDVVPSDTTFIRCSDGCTVDLGLLRWEIGTVAAGSGNSVTFAVQVDDSLETGSQIHNVDYGISADQTGFIAGPAVSTMVNRDAAIFDGYTFVDADGNGLYDESIDSPLSGIAITLPASTGSPTTTNDSGYYRLRVEVAGPVSISAELPDGYFRTTAGTVLTDSVLGLTQTVSFGYAPVGAGFGVVYGTVYADANHNGQRELGESGLPGVDVGSEVAVTPAVQTDAYGRYTLQYVAPVPVTVTISEEDPDGYVSTTPNEVATEVVNGSSDGSPVDFGDFYGILVTGQVFEDVDVDGVKDGTEVGLAGAIVAGNGDSYTTAASGVYTLYVALEGADPVTIQETDPAGYVSTAALPGAGMEAADANTLLIPSPVSGNHYADGDFGDVHASQVITISGTVWDDNGALGGTLANGLRDGGEPGLAGAVVSLSSGLSQTTGADGAFLLYAPAGEAIVVTETNPAGYVSTNAIPGNDAIKVNHDVLQVGPLSAASTSSENLFGDVALSSAAVITGTVFDDANENGVHDAGEDGLPGVAVTLQIEEDNTIVALTGAAGDYQFAVTPGTNVRLSSAGPGGAYYPTTPEVLIVQPMVADTVYPGNNFGYSDDTEVAVIYGLVFEDLNSNAEQDFGELGLGDAVVELEGQEPVTTMAEGPLAGTFVFTVTQPGVYVVHESNPPGYRSTTPDHINVPVEALGSSHRVDFGDVDNPETATIYGTVFDDLNSNGVQDSTEPGLGGVVISATVGGETGVVTATTRTYGQFTYGFEVARPGIHTVSEQDPALPGYHSTTPDQINVDVSLGESYIVNFGDTANTNPFSTIMGIVFSDDDGNGVQDAAELGIEGVEIALSDGATATTETYGQYTFALDATGYYQVTETDLPGYHSTTPNTVTVQVEELGRLYIVNFGDTDDPFSTSFFGTVFEDSNVNGARDLEELGLAGVAVSLNDLVPAYVTNEWGQYTFLLEQAGTYTVTEADLAGYVSTVAIPGDASVAALDANTLRAEVVSLGSDLGDNLFGDVQASQVVAISGTAWDDNGAAGGVAANGLWDGDEPGLAGAVVSLSSGLVATTGPDGTFLLYAPPGQSITVTETNPGGYVSTAAIPGSGDVTRLDDDRLQVGPLDGGSTSDGNLFGDVLPTDLSIVKAGDPDPVAPGGVLTYTLTYANEGMQLSSEVYVTDTLDANTAFGGVVSQPLGWVGPDYDPGPPATLTWYSPTLAAGASGSLVFTVTVSAEVTHGMVLTNTAYITGTVPELDRDNNVYTETTGIAPQEALIYGTVFEDLDGDGLQQLGVEPGLAGVLLTLDEILTTTTDLDGAYTFVVTEAMTYTVAETDPEEYLSTTPNTVTVTVELGDAAEVNFGDLWIGHCGCPPDEYEEDDAVGQAVALTAGVVQTHDFCDDAADWTWFSAEAGQVFTLTTSSWGRRADTFLALYDTDGTTRLAANDDYEGSTDFSSSIVWQAPVSGTYFVQVSNQAELTGCLTAYDLWLETPTPAQEYHVYLPLVMRDVNMEPVVAAAEVVEPRGVINHVCPDDYEVDDTWQQAVPLEPGVAQVHSFDSNPAVYAADKDFVQLDLSAGDSVTVSVTSLTNTMTVLELYDGQGNALGLTGDTQLVWTADQDGTYIVGIGPPRRQTMCGIVGYHSGAAPGSPPERKPPIIYDGLRRPRSSTKV
jgi:uncharacterized repeat protein (TIGR01451 family)